MKIKKQELEIEETTGDINNIEIEDLENGQVMFWHKECWNKRNEPEGGQAI